MIYWTVFRYKDWEFIIAATENGLCFTGSENHGVEELITFANKFFKGIDVVEAEAKLTPYIEQLQRYFECKHSVVNFPLDIKGTKFQMSVWDALCSIPHGTTCSYSEVAEQLGNPKAVRAVGTAIGANPVMIAIPCHRVIGKNGTLTGFRGGLGMKRKLLELEGVKL